MVNTHPNGKFEKSSAAKDVHRPTLKGGVWGDSFPGFPKTKKLMFSNQLSENPILLLKQNYPSIKF